jgi:hypothetical protein
MALRRRCGLTGPDTKASGCGAPVISGDFWGPFLGKQWWTPCQRGHLRRGNKRNPVESYTAWWFQTIFIFHFIWDVIPPIDELTYFKMVKTC